MATPVVMGAPRPAPFFTPLFVAIDKGFLAEEGLDGSMRYLMSLEGLERGEIDFLSGGSAYRHFLNGADIRMVCGLSVRETSHVLMVRPEVESVDRLEHVLLPGSSGRQGERFVDELRSILAMNGCDLDQSKIDTQHIAGSHKEQWDLLKQGVGDAATLGAPWWFFAAKEGYRNLGNEGDYNPSPSGSGIYVTPEKIAQSPEVVEGFVRAYARSMRYCLENVEGTMETMMKYSREWGVDNPEIARQAYDEVAPYWRLEVDVAEMEEGARRAAAKMGQPPISVDSFLDLSFLDRALQT